MDGKSAAPQLVQLLKPGAENPAVQAKAWETLTGFLPELEGNELEVFADSFKDNKDTAKSVVVLRAKLEKETKAGEFEDRAATLLNIGECLMDPQEKQYSDAAANFDAALTAYSGLPTPNKTMLNSLIQKRTQALLLAGRYDDATRFADTSIKNDPSQTTIMGDLIEGEADRLSSDGEQSPDSLENALKLIDATRKNLTLPQRYLDDLGRTEADVRRAQAKNKGSGSTLAAPGSNGATARTAD